MGDAKEATLGLRMAASGVLLVVLAAGGVRDATGAEGACPAGDARDLLRAFAPAEPRRASAFEAYLGEELGAVACATAGRGGSRTVRRPIVVPPNAVYDGHGERLTAHAAAMACDTRDGEQAEGQKPLFVLAPGAQLRNVTITAPGCDGVHMFGDNVLENVVWEDVGEDAASVRSYFPGGAITVRDSRAYKAADKVFQFNAPAEVRIERFEGDDIGKLVRQNGGATFELRVDLHTVTVTGVVSAVVQSDSPRCFVRHHALDYTFRDAGAGSDRVFRGIPARNVTAY